MMNIEQLAIEHGSTCYTGQQYHFDKWQLQAFAKALQQQSEPVKCMVCGHGYLYCDNCGTGIYSPQKQQQSEPVEIARAVPEIGARLPNGEVVTNVYQAYEEGLKSQQQSEPVYQICFDCNGNWVDVPSCEYERECNFGKRILFTQPPNTVSLGEFKKLLGKIAELEADLLACSNENIALRDAIAEAERSAK